MYACEIRFDNFSANYVTKVILFFELPKIWCILLHKNYKMLNDILQNALENKKATRLSGFFWLVGMARFELTTSCSQSRHSNRAELHPAHFLSRKRVQRYCFFFIWPNIFQKKVYFFIFFWRFILLLLYFPPQKHVIIFFYH